MKKGFIYLIGAVTIWSISSGLIIPLIKLSSFVFYGIGSFFSLIFLLLILAFKKHLNRSFKYPRKIVFFMALIGLGTAINNGLFFTGLKAGSVANAALTHYLGPVFVAFIFAPLILREKLTLKTFFLVILSFLGLLILMLPTLQTSFDLAILYGSLSAIFFALFVVIEKKVTQMETDALTTVFYISLVPFILFGPLAIGDIMNGITVHEWLLLALWGILVPGISFTLFFEGIKRVSATSASILGYGEPLGAIILAFIFFKQPINVYIIIGGFLIILSGILIVKKPKLKT